MPPRKPRFASEVAFTAPLPVPSPAHARLVESGLTPDDDEHRESSLSSSSSVQDENRWLIEYLARTWKFPGANFAIAKYGADLITDVGALLDEMIRTGQMRRPRNPGAYLRRCLDWALLAREHAERTPAPQVAPPAAALPSPLRVILGGLKEASK